MTSPVRLSDALLDLAAERFPRIHIHERNDMPQATHLHPRAEVVGYPEPVLEAVRDLVHEVNAHPELAAFSGQMMAGISAGLVAEDPRASTFMSAIARLVIVTADASVANGSDVGEGSR